MSVDLDRLEAEHPFLLQIQAGRWHLFVGSAPTDVCYVLARLTGARFDDNFVYGGVPGCVMLPWPGHDDDHRGVAEALIAQWEGLSPCTRTMIQGEP